MKKLLFLLVFITSFSFGQDVKVIENKVCELYKTYSKKRGINAIVRTELDSLSYCQVRYLSSLENISQMSHTTNFEGLESFHQRVIYFYQYTNESHFAEVLSGFYKGENNYGNEDEIAKKLFGLLLSSPPHKKILDKRINKSYTFRVTRTLNGSYILIGVLSGDETFFLR
jgi:hypothetical protein